MLVVISDAFLTLSAKLDALVVILFSTRLSYLHHGDMIICEKYFFVIASYHESLRPTSCVMAYLTVWKSSSFANSISPICAEMNPDYLIKHRKAKFLDSAMSLTIRGGIKAASITRIS